MARLRKKSVGMPRPNKTFKRVREVLSIDVGAGASGSSVGDAPNLSTTTQSLSNARNLLPPTVQQKIAAAELVLAELDRAKHVPTREALAADDHHKMELRLFEAKMERWDRTEKRKPPPSPLNQLEKLYKARIQLLESEERTSFAFAMACSAACEAKDAQIKLQTIELKAFRSHVASDSRKHRSQKKKVS